VVTWVGTAGWAVALVVLLIVRGSLPPGQRWWIWTCACGLVMGLFALWYVPRLKRGRARSAARSAAESEPESEQGQSAPRDNGSNTVSSTETPGRSTRS
jgi:type VI protein secretion system component VasK